MNTAQQCTRHLQPPNLTKLKKPHTPRGPVSKHLHTSFTSRVQIWLKYYTLEWNDYSNSYNMDGWAIMVLDYSCINLQTTHIPFHIPLQPCIHTCIHTYVYTHAHTKVIGIDFITPITAIIDSCSLPHTRLIHLLSTQYGTVQYSTACTSDIAWPGTAILTIIIINIITIDPTHNYM